MAEPSQLAEEAAALLLRPSNHPVLLVVAGFSVNQEQVFVSWKENEPVSKMSEQKHILVLGAGVIGLQTAISLLQTGYDVTVLAEHLPGDTSVEYTSPWAAAMWRSNGLPHEHEIQAWDRESYQLWLRSCVRPSVQDKLTVTTPPKGSSITGVPMRLFWTGPHEFIPDGPESLWYAPHVQNFRVLESAELPRPFVCGAIHDGIAINTNFYLISLASTIRALGGRIIRASLPREGGLAQAIMAAEEIVQSDEGGGIQKQQQHPVDLFVNATGLGARTLVPDSDVYPIRGQTVTVRGEAKNITTMFYPGANASITPRVGSGVSVLGSTYQAGNWDRNPDPQVTRTILERCKALGPELLNDDGEFDVVSVDVAFRPGRRGGPRVELEEIVIDGVTEDGLEIRTRVVCHEYGHAGGGYQNSFGSARKVVELVNSWFRQENNVDRARL